MKSVVEHLGALVKDVEILLKEIEDLNEKIVRLKEERKKILKERPAPLKPGWKMPKAPVCPHCGVKVRAVAYFDTEEVSFSWDEWCGNCGNIIDYNDAYSDFDEWPFEVDRVYASDVENAGFEVE